MKLSALAGVFALVACSPGPASAGTLQATPETLSAQLAAAKPGDTIVLAKNRQYGDVVLPARNNAAPIEIVAKDATLRSLTIQGTSGWRWTGGVIDSPMPPAVWRNVTILDAHRIEVADVTLTGGDTGAVISGGSSDIVMRGNTATGLRNQGFNIATAKRISLVGNTCTDFKPIPAEYDASGKMVKDGTHPDCIHMWSEAGQEPTSDIEIIGNKMRGAMQGIAHYWHPQLGRDKVYRVKAWNNDIEVGYWWGLALENTPGSDIRNNRVATTPGAVDIARPDQKITARMVIDEDARQCGNTVNGAMRGGKCD